MLGPCPYALGHVPSLVLCFVPFLWLFHNQFMEKPCGCAIIAQCNGEKIERSFDWTGKFGKSQNFPVQWEFR